MDIDRKPLLEQQAKCRQMANDPKLSPTSRQKARDLLSHAEVALGLLDAMTGKRQRPKAEGLNA